ncbi:MAG: hypothetical protein ACREQ2_06125 [Candidatus Binatia bacterium]
METSIWTKQLGCTLFLAALATLWGCESVSLLGRESIAPGYEQRSDIDRRGDYDRRDRFDRESRQGQIYGTVQEVDERRSEIRLRTDDGRTSVVRYDNSTRISGGSRDMRVGSLRSGDSVSIQLERNSGGEQYAYAIRVEDRRDSGWR